MAVFAYKALDATGRTVAGTLLADSPAEGRRQLRQRGVRIEHFAPAAERPGSTGLQWTSRARRQACVAEFARLLALLLGAAFVSASMWTLARELIAGWRLRQTNVTRDDHGEFESELEPGWSWRRSVSSVVVSDKAEMKLVTLEIVRRRGTNVVVASYRWLEDP